MDAVRATTFANSLTGAVFISNRRAAGLLRASSDSPSPAQGSP
jgi:hypothetical protein